VLSISAPLASASANANSAVKHINRISHPAREQKRLRYFDRIKVTAEYAVCLSL
jgi:hypothetical protein